MRTQERKRIGVPAVQQRLDFSAMLKFRRGTLFLG